MQFATRLQCGFSLIELIIVMMVISAGAITILGAFQQAGRALLVSEEVQVATLAAQECADFVVTSHRNQTLLYADIDSSACDSLPAPSAGLTRPPLTVTALASGGGSAPCPTGASCKQVEVAILSGSRTAASSVVMVVDYQ
jgi:prepilin-type N-terminal cleavage/methylation domain-containing protein